MPRGEPCAETNRACEGACKLRAAVMGRWAQPAHQVGCFSRRPRYLLRSASFALWPFSNPRQRRQFCRVDYRAARAILAGQVRHLIVQAARAAGAPSAGPMGRPAPTVAHTREA